MSGGTLTCDMVDILRVSGVPGLRSAPSLYDQLSTRWLKFYNLSFRITNNVRSVDMISRLLYLQDRRHIGRTLMAANPQLVVVTHPLVHRLVGAARRTYRLPFRMVTVVTDLVSLHASWTYKGTDFCLLPTDESYDLMGRRGMPAERMGRTGFPVHPKFARYNRTRQESRRELQIAEDATTILLTSGGVGSGRMHELALELEQACPDKQLLVITGKNQALYDELQAARRNAHTHIFGFVDNMETLMAASDIIVSKAGPGTLMEALIIGRPVLVTEAVGMQERGNIDFVVNRDLGYFCPTTERVVNAIRELDDPQRYQATIARIQGVPGDGALQIAAVLLEQLQQTPLPPGTPRRRLLLPRLSSWHKMLRRSRKQRKTEMPADEAVATLTQMPV
jgi:UDP-N-acetylglucosamine:LPS N-acetylglucosamine transferase